MSRVATLPQDQHRHLEDRPVTVVGAGPGGAVVALLLARAGAAVTLLERSDESRPVGAGILLQPNGLAVLDGLGLADELRALGSASRSIRLVDADGRILTEAPVTDFGPGLDHVLAVRRSDLAAALGRATEAEPAITSIWGAKVLKASPNGVVTYRQDGMVHTLASELVVGADGVASAVRESGRGRHDGFGVRVGPERHRYLRGLVELGDDQVPMAEHWTPLGLFGCAPVGIGLTYFYGDADSPDVADALASGDLDGLVAAWGGTLPVAGRLLSALENTDALMVNGARTITCRRWSIGRIALLGDAAHAMEPTLGQGANSALVDALVLVEELLADGTGRRDLVTLATALSRYEERRRPAVWKVQRNAAGVAFLASRRGSIARGVRDRVMRLTDRPGAAEARYRVVQQEHPVDLRDSVRLLTAACPEQQESHPVNPTTLTIPADSDTMTPEWMTAALARDFPGVEVTGIELLLRDDGTNRRARLGLEYATGAGAVAGPSTVFVKAADPAHARLNAKTGGVFNEARLFLAGADLPLDHPAVYLSLIDEDDLNFFLVMEDVVARGADPRDSTRPLSVEQATNGVRALARLHSAYWGDRFAACSQLSWVGPLVAWTGMARGIDIGLQRAADLVPSEVLDMTGDHIEGHHWARYVSTLPQGPPTLLHGDAHVGNTYVLPGDDVGFLDWQVLRRGNQSLDLEYFLQGAVTVDDRRSSEEAIVGAYHEALELPADELPTFDDVWLRYRASVAHGLALWLATAASDTWQRPAVSLALAERYAAAWVDLDSPAAIEQLVGTA